MKRDMGGREGETEREGYRDMSGRKKRERERGVRIQEYVSDVML